MSRSPPARLRQRHRATAGRRPPAATTTPPTCRRVPARRAGSTSINGWTTTSSIRDTAATGVASCTGSAGNSGNSWITTICTPNNTSNVPVASCSGSSSTSANGYTTTTCSTNNTSNVPVATCSAGSPTSGNAQYEDDDLHAEQHHERGVGQLQPLEPHLRQRLHDDDLPGPGGRAGRRLVVHCSHCQRRQQLDGDRVPRHSRYGSDAGGLVLQRRWRLDQRMDLDCLQHNDDSGPTVVTSCNPASADVGNSYTATICAPLSVDPQAVTTYTRCSNSLVMAARRPARVPTSPRLRARMPPERATPPARSRPCPSTVSRRGLRQTRRAIHPVLRGPAP